MEEEARPLVASVGSINAEAYGAAEDSQLPPAQRQQKAERSQRAETVERAERAEREEEGEVAVRLEPHARKPYVPASDSALAVRMRYYNRLAGGEAAAARRFELPQHVIPSELFFPALPGMDNDPEAKRSSLSLVFSIWNTMMGSSLLALPWGLSESGFALGLAMVFVIGAVCCYTCLLILKHGKESADFFYLCNDYLGAWGKWLCWASSVLMLAGASIAYDILMADVLEASVEGVVNIGQRAVQGEDYVAWVFPTWLAPLLVLCAIFPVSNLKSFSLLVKLNSLGVLPIIYTVFFIVTQCLFQEGLDVGEHDVPQASSGAFVLAGVLSVSFYIHSLILPVMKAAEHPEHNSRNVVFGFVLVAASYSIVGGVAYLAYWDLEGGIPQEFLQVYENTKPGALLANMLLLFQLATIYPLLLLIVRIQFFGLLWKSQYPGRVHVWSLNFILIAGATFFALFFADSFGTILGITGAFFGTIVVFILPIAVHLAAMKQQTGSWGIIRTPVHLGIVVGALAVAVGQFVF